MIQKNYIRVVCMHLLENGIGSTTKSINVSVFYDLNQNTFFNFKRNGYEINTRVLDY